MDSTYIASFGHTRALAPDFIDVASSGNLASREKILEILKSPPYSRNLERYSILYRPPELVEVVVNSTFVDRMLTAFSFTPPTAKPFVKEYISKFDIDNVVLLISAKILKKQIELVEPRLITIKGMPASFDLGLIQRSEYLELLKKDSLESLYEGLYRHERLSALRDLPSAERGNVYAVKKALESSYYSRLLSSFKFYNGNEWQIRSFLKSLIDIRNMMNIIKCTDSGIKFDDYLIDGGSLTKREIIERFSNQDMEKITENSGFELKKELELYKDDGLVSRFEMKMREELLNRYYQVFRANPMSIGDLLWYILRAEDEKTAIIEGWYNVEN